MRRDITALTRALAIMLLGAALPASAQAAEVAAAGTLEQWRTERLAALTADSGFLTLVGLFWLEPGRNSFGRARSNALVLDHPVMPRRLGHFELEDGRVRFVAARGASVLESGRPVTATPMQADSAGAPTVLRHGTLDFFVIERAGQLGVRVRDLDNPRRRGFPGIEYFDADEQWRIAARFEPYQPVRQISILNILGMESDMPSPGAIVFEKDGRKWRLDAIDESPGAPTLFVMFADGTSGRESYGAGRFLEVPRPVDGRLVIDFNRAYNPPCAFNEFATCPLPPEQNRLSLRITAGERKFPPADAAH
jgi:hypothetical protein